MLQGYTNRKKKKKISRTPEKEDMVSHKKIGEQREQRLRNGDIKIPHSEEMHLATLNYRCNSRRITRLIIVGLGSRSLTHSPLKALTSQSERPNG